jgi:MFS family permease
MVTFAVVALGIGQSLSIPALVAAALALSQPAVAAYGQGPVMAVLRLLERLGGATGPLLAAVLSTSYGIGVAMGLFGFYSLVSAFLLLLVMHFSDRRRHRRHPKPPAINVELP